MAEKETVSYDMKKKASDKPQRPKGIPFLELVTGHSFVVTDAGSMPKDEYFWCAFCGGRGTHYVTLKRDDKRNFKVGRTCLGRVGLTSKDIPEELSQKVDIAKHPSAVPVQAVNGNNAVPPPLKGSSVDDEIEELLKSL